MLTENEISRSWNRLFRNGNISAETWTRAAALIDELREESPLRIRLQSELEELRSLHAEEVEA